MLNKFDAESVDSNEIPAKLFFQTDAVALKLFHPLKYSFAHLFFSFSSKILLRLICFPRISLFLPSYRERRPSQLAKYRPKFLIVVPRRLFPRVPIKRNYPQKWAMPIISFTFSLSENVCRTEFLINAWLRGRERKAPLPLIFHFVYRPFRFIPGEILRNVSNTRGVFRDRRGARGHFSTLITARASTLRVYIFHYWLAGSLRGSRRTPSQPIAVRDKDSTLRLHLDR